MILGAGFSSRFGRNKLLELIGTSSLIEHVVSEALNSESRQVIVVYGHDHDKVTETLNGFHCELVFNEYYSSGQSSSVRKGISAVDERAEGVMVMPGDMPLMNHAIINSVIREFANTSANIVAASHNGRAGHPILFSRDLFKDILEIEEQSKGLKKVVSKYQENMLLVETGEGSLCDVDTKEDMVRVLAYLASQS